METLSDDQLAGVRLKLAGDGTGSNEYYAERRQGIREGKPTWEVRNFDAYGEYAYDLYADKQRVGMVREVVNDGCRAYKYTAETGEEPVLLFDEMLSLPDAVALVEGLLPPSDN